MYLYEYLCHDGQAECEHTGLMFVGRGRVLEFNENSFTPGKPHVVDVACDLWPTIVYQGEKGYKGLVVAVPKAPIDDVKVIAVRTRCFIIVVCIVCLFTGILVIALLVYR